MSSLFIVLALVFAGLRYAVSALDNAIIYARGRWPLPDIHVVEQGQQLFAQLSFMSMAAALIAATGEPWLNLLWYGVALAGAYQLFSPLFNLFIRMGTGQSLSDETTRWRLPLNLKWIAGVYSISIWKWTVTLTIPDLLVLQVPKVFAGRRRYAQIPFGIALIVVSFLLLQ